MKKYSKLWNVIKNEIETINGSKEYEYGKNFMKIKFDTNDNLPLYKTLKLHISVFEENSKFYPQIYLDECLYEL